MKKQVPILLLLICTSDIYAGELSLDYSQSSQTKTEDLSASNDFNSDKTETKPNTTFDWNATYSHSASNVTTTPTPTTDNTHDFSAGLGLTHTSGFTASFDYDFSNTPEEELSSSGPSISLGYKYKFSAPEPLPEEKEISNFSPSLAIDLSWATTAYDQKFSTSRRQVNGVVRPVKGNETISQKMNGLSFKYKATDWLTAKAGYKKYSYNKDVNQFLQYLDSHKVIASVSTGLSQALGGFYDNQKLIELDFFLGEDWEIDLEHLLILIQTDSSLLTVEKILISYDLTDSFRLSLGAETSKPELSSAETTSKAGLSYQF